MTIEFSASSRPSDLEVDHLEHDEIAEAHPHRGAAKQELG
jgi:hypothetical protein